ncbi:hypothetical protein C8J56DRAFT_852040, partial [Mycena floridula]
RLTLLTAPALRAVLRPSTSYDFARRLPESFIISPSAAITFCSSYLKPQPLRLLLFRESLRLFYLTLHVQSLSEVFNLFDLLRLALIPS